MSRLACARTMFVFLEWYRRMFDLLVSTGPIGVVGRWSSDFMLEELSFENENCSSFGDAA